MRYTIFCALALAAAAVPARAALIGLSLSPGPILAGSTFQLTVQVTDLAGDSFTAFGMNPFISDPTKVAYLSAVVDPSLNDDSGFFGGNPAIAGDASLPISTVPITLATLSFQALAPGTVNVGVSSDLNDVNQGLFLIGGTLDLTTSQSIEVTSESTGAVPEPASFGLLAMALGGLCYRLRKCR